MEEFKRNDKFLSYSLDRIIYKGHFGSYWKAEPEKYKHVIIKFGNSDQPKSILQHEAEILKEIQPSNYFPKYYGHGTEQGITYLILGDFFESLDKFIEERNQRELDTSFYKIGNIGIEMLKALREIHELGFVHRNISPYSFVFESFHVFEVLLTDFGLAKRWRSPDGEIYPPRKNVGLRGMSRYASISSHEGMDWGRVDDLWSFFLCFD